MVYLICSLIIEVAKFVYFLFVGYQNSRKKVSIEASLKVININTNKLLKLNRSFGKSLIKC